MRRTPSLASLRLFLLVAHKRSFSEAGRAANLSQPALSRTIRILEEQLGTSLFDRDSRNVRLTPAGEMLLPTVERLTGDFDHAFADLSRRFAGERGRVVVGSLPSVAAITLPRVIASFRESHPQVEVILRDDLSGTLAQQMQERQIDLAVTTSPEDPRFRFDPLFRDAVVLVVPRGGMLDDGLPASWSIFRNHPFIAMSPNSSVREITDSAMARAGVVAPPLYECAHLATVGALIEAGLGLTALPKSTLGMLHAGQIVARPLRDPLVERTIGLVHLVDRTLPPAAEAFRRHYLEQPTLPASA